MQGISKEMQAKQTILDQLKLDARRLVEDPRTDDASASALARVNLDNTVSSWGDLLTALNDRYAWNIKYRYSSVILKCASAEFLYFCTVFCIFRHFMWL